MRLEMIKISNFRCFNEPVSMKMEQFTSLVGKNDAGKSTILESLNIFFGGTDGKAKPDVDDKNVYSSSNILEISCIFSNFPVSIVIDEDVPTSLKEEYLLNQEDSLEIVKQYDYESKCKCSEFIRAYHPSNTGLDDLHTLTTAKLKARAKELGVDLANVNQTINKEIRKELWSKSTALSFQEKLIDAKKIMPQIEKEFPVFALFKSDRPSTDQDAEAQDPMKIAAKEAIKEQESSLNQIVERVKEEIEKIANSTVEKIRELNPELANELKPRVTNKNWDSLFSVSLTDEKEIPINKRGSGTRRLVLLSFFRAKAESSNAGKDIIYAIEEPETSQHPNHQRLLLDSLIDLTESNNRCQVLITTHNPNMLKDVNTSNIRFVHDNIIENDLDDSILARITKTLGIIADHKVKVFCGVEGKNDIEFLKRVAKKFREEHPEIACLEEAENNGTLMFVPVAGSNLSLWINRLSQFNRPEFYMVDRDASDMEKPKYNEHIEELKKRDNCNVFVTKHREAENYIHHDTIKTLASNYTGTGDSSEDVPDLYAQVIHSASDSVTPWASLDNEKKSKKRSHAKKHLNTTILDALPISELKERDSDSELFNWLKSLSIALNGDTTETAKV